MHDGKLQLLSFHYSKHYSKLQLPELVSDLLNSAAFQQRLQVATKAAGWAQLHGSTSGLKQQQVPASDTRMDMFDRLLTADPPIVRRSGQGDIIKCMDDVVDGIQVGRQSCRCGRRRIMSEARVASRINGSSNSSTSSSCVEEAMQTVRI
jgi:hypothetical protein